VLLIGKKTDLIGTGKRAANLKDFIDEGGSGRKKCLRTGSEQRQLLALGFSGDVEGTPFVVRGSTRH
jgi:hypothetical protein